jgi:DNA-binding SARP family transcriptional activator
VSAAASEVTAFLAEIDGLAVPADVEAAVAGLAGRLAAAGCFDAGDGRRRLLRAADRIAAADPERAVRLLLDAWRLARPEGDLRELTAIAVRAGALGAPLGGELAAEVETVGRVVLALDDAGAAAERAATLDCTVLGRFRVTAGGRRIPLPGLAGRLVAFLAVQAAPVAGDEVIEALWPEVDPDQARGRLRKVVWRIRRAHPGLVARQGDLLGLDGAVSVDAAAFAVAAREAVAAPSGSEEAGSAARAALARYGGELLPELRYEEWTVAPRQRLQRRYLDVLDVLAADALARDDDRAAAAFLDRAIDADPYDEARYVRCAGLLAGHGRRGPALQLLARAGQAMADLGVAPSPAARDLEGLIRQN